MTKKISSQTAATVSKEKVEEALQSIYRNINIAAEIIDFSKNKGWSKKELFEAIKIIQSLEHFS